MPTLLHQFVNSGRGLLNGGEGRGIQSRSHWSNHIKLRKFMLNHRAVSVRELSFRHIIMLEGVSIRRSHSIQEVA